MKKHAKKKAGQAPLKVRPVRGRKPITMKRGGAKREPGPIPCHSPFRVFGSLAFFWVGGLRLFLLLVAKKRRFSSPRGASHLPAFAPRRWLPPGWPSLLDYTAHPPWPQPHWVLPKAPERTRLPSPLPTRRNPARPLAGGTPSQMASQAPREKAAPGGRVGRGGGWKATQAKRGFSAGAAFPK